MEKSTLLYVALSTALTACCNIGDEERLIYVEPVQSARSVLIEDFTGQRCSNCPTAIEEIEKIEAAYGKENIIAVSIHSGPLGFAGNGSRIGLMTDTGNEYYNSWGTIDHQPMGIVNRTGKPTDYVFWAEQVYNEIQKTTPIKIEVTADYDDTSSDTMSISVEVFSSESTSGKLQLWIVEDGITAMQTIPDGTVNMEYIHNHVFRKAVNGTWGENIDIDTGSTVKRTYTTTIDDGWNIDNLSIVTFIYDDDGVKQTKRTYIKQQ